MISCFFLTQVDKLLNPPRRIILIKIVFIHLVWRGGTHTCINANCSSCWWLYRHDILLLDSLRPYFRLCDGIWKYHFKMFKISWFRICRFGVSRHLNCRNHRGLYLLELPSVDRTLHYGFAVTASQWRCSPCLCSWYYIFSEQ